MRACARAACACVCVCRSLRRCKSSSGSLLCGRGRRRGRPTACSAAYRRRCARIRIRAPTRLRSCKPARALISARGDIKVMFQSGGRRTEQQRRDQQAENKLCIRHCADSETDVEYSVRSAARHQSRMVASDHRVRTVIGTAAPAPVPITVVLEVVGSGAAAAAPTAGRSYHPNKSALRRPRKGTRPTSAGQPRRLEAHRSASGRGYFG